MVRIGKSWLQVSRKHIIRKLQRYGIDLSSGIEFEQVATPESIEKMTLSTAGALYGNSSNSATSAFNRHPNFSRKIKNLFFAGGSVHPGGGIPLCLASAKIVEHEVQSYLQIPVMKLSIPSESNIIPMSFGLCTWSGSLVFPFLLAMNCFVA